MALLWADSFSTYGTADNDLLLDGSYSEISVDAGVNCVADPDGVSTQNVLKLTSTGAVYVRKVLSTPGDVIIIGTRIWLASLPAADGGRPYVFNFRNNGNNSIGYVTVDTTGHVSFYYLQSGDTPYTPTLVGQSTSPVITAGAWWHIECKLDTSTPSVEIRVEGVSVFESTDFTVHANATTIYQYLLRRNTTAGNGSVVYFKDHTVCDDSGSTNNTFLGTVRVYNIKPDADSVLNWTPSTGAVGWSITDNQPPNDAQYLTAADTLPDVSTFTLTDLPGTVDVVKGVMTKVRASKSDGGEGNLQVSFSGTAGTDRPIAASFNTYHDIFQTSMTPTTVNAATITIDRTA